MRQKQRAACERPVFDDLCLIATLSGEIFRFSPGGVLSSLLGDPITIFMTEIVQKMTRIEENKRRLRQPSPLSIKPG